MIVNAMMGRLHVRNSDQTGQSGVCFGGEVVGSNEKTLVVYGMLGITLPSFIGITLPETNIAPENGWNTTFLLGRPIFRCYVSFKECIRIPANQSVKCWCFFTQVLSRQKFSSNVVERCLQLASGEDGDWWIWWKDGSGFNERKWKKHGKRLCNPRSRLPQPFFFEEDITKTTSAAWKGHFHICDVF